MGITELKLPSAAPSPLKGFIDRFEIGEGHIYVSGWTALADGNFPELPLSVRIGDDITFDVQKFYHRDDLAEAGIADGNCGFSVLVHTTRHYDSIPEIHVMARSGSYCRLEEGATLKRFAPTGSLEITDGSISGFLIDPEVWSGKLKADLVVNDRVSIPLSLVKQDFADQFEIIALSGNPAEPPSARFEVSAKEFLSAVREHSNALSARSEQNYTISLFSGRNEVSRQTKIAGPSGIGRLEAVRGTTIFGWAAGSNRSEPCSVDILWDGIVYTTIRATDQREDLIRKKIVTTGGGFRYSFSRSPGDDISGQITARLTESLTSLTYDTPMKVNTSPIESAKSAYFQIKTAEKSLPVSIVIPIYNAASDLRLCLSSISARTSLPARLILVDDCSPDPEINLILKEWESNPGVTVVRNTKNLGFSGTINTGIAEAGRSDVVILNSDTIVTQRWLESLHQAAYSDVKVGTVTAMSNNAGAFSVPDMGSNVYNPWLSLEAIALLVRQASAGLYPEVPTGNGFCMYIKRECIDEVGLLDHEAFPRGYGEENDFCMRALRLGFRHIVDDRSFVYHKRSASFGDEKTDLYEAGRAVVASRYPEYARLTNVFSSDPRFLSIRWRVRKALAAFEAKPVSYRPRVLYVISTQTGGTPQTNRDLMGALGDRYETWLLRCDASKVYLSRYENEQTIDISTHALSRPLVMSIHESREYDEVVKDILMRYSFDIVHIRHIAWHGLRLSALCRGLQIPAIFSFHDFYAVCPTVKLLDENLSFCGGRCTSGAGECTAQLWPTGQIPPLKHRFIHEWQRKMDVSISHCDALITTSPGTAALVTDIFPSVAAKGIHVIPHGRTFDSMEAAAAVPHVDEALRILVPGNLDVAKGSRICNELLALPVRREIELHVLGEPGDLVSQPGLVLHGRYKRDEFGEKVRGIRPHIGVIFSIWPETYCHTLTEMWACGVPVVAIDRGAVGERIRAMGGGWLVPPDATVEQINALLRQIRRGQANIAEKRDQIVRWQTQYGKFYSTQIMAMQYDAIYRNTLRKRMTLAKSPTENAIFVAVISQFNPGRKSPASAHIRVGEMTRNNVDQPVIFQHYSSYAVLEIDLEISFSAVLVQRDTIDPEDIPHFLNICRHKNIRIIVDCDDDLLSVPAEKDAGGRYLAGRSGLTMLLQAADLVTLSTEPLVQALGPYTGNAVLVPNMLSARLWGGSIPQKTSPAAAEEAQPTAIYMGTVTHDADLQLLKSVVQIVRKRHPNFRMLVIGGQRENDGWFERLDDGNTPKDYPEFVGWFREQCTKADFALGALIDTDFNRCKSDLKYLDYAAAGLAGVYSDVPAYRSTVQNGVTGVLVANHMDAWVDAIEWMIENPGHRYAMASRAYEDVRATRMSLFPGQQLCNAISKLMGQEDATPCRSAAA
jgi:GT2 family glycosyltransferase